MAGYIGSKGSGIISGIDASIAELNLNDKASANGTTEANKVLTADANKDVTAVRNLTATGTVQGLNLTATGVVQGASATITGVTTTTGLTLGSTAITATGADINALKVQGKETIYVPASAMYPNSTNGSSGLEQVELTNGPELKVLDFDPSTAEYAQFSVVFPKSWNEGTVTFQAFFTVNGTDTGTVGWGLSGVSIADDVSTDTAFGTNVLATAKAHSGVANDLDVTAESGPVTIASAAEDCYTFFQIMRDATNDTQTADARLMGIKLFFTTNAKNDA